MQKIDIHLDGISPEQVRLAANATDTGTQIRIHLAPPEVDTERPEPTLKQTMTFDEFIVEPGNEFA